MDHKGVMRDHTRGTVNLSELKKVLLSKDMALYDQYRKKYLDDKVLRFLTGDPISGDRTCYLSYMRSGNTFLRKYLELITGVVTGSEMPLSMPMPLNIQGMFGENVADDTVWIVKSHCPMRVDCLDFKVNKFIVCVRNPFDVILSTINFLNSMTHGKELENKPWIEEPEMFDYWVRFQANYIAKY